VNDLNPRVRVHVPRMLQLAGKQIDGNWHQRGDRLLLGAARLDKKAPWWVHRRRLDLRLASITRGRTCRGPVDDGAAMHTEDCPGV
jgi:hypothetical protein